LLSAHSCAFTIDHMELNSKTRRSKLKPKTPLT
jgi:hypothetical protein